MIRYTPEQKAEALKSMETIGVNKTKEALGISVQTLYKWKNEGTEPKASGAKRSRKRTAQIDPAVREAMSLLSSDEQLEKIAALEQENAKLLEINAKLKKALATFLE